jgi:hypothetical protein
VTEKRDEDYDQRERNRIPPIALDDEREQLRSPAGCMVAVA